MIKKLRTLALAILAFIFVIWNKDIIPVKREITQLQLVQSIGMDLGKNNKYKISFLSNQKASSTAGQSSNSNGSSSSSISASSQKLATVEASTFNSGLKNFQSVSAKYVPLSHVKYIFLGEEIAKTDFTSAIDFIARDEQARINARIFIVKGKEAEYFFKNATNKDYELEDRLKSMEEDAVLESVVTPIDILDVIDMMVSDNSAGVIPALRIISAEDKNEEQSKKESSNNDKDEKKNSEQNTAENKESKNDNGQLGEIKGGIENNKNDKITVNMNIGNQKENLFDYEGYAVIKDRKLVGYLSKDESIIYNMLIGKFENTTVNITDEDNQSMSFGLKDSNTKINFDFEDKHLKNINIYMNVKANIEEADKDEVITDIKVLQEYQDKIDEVLKKDTESLLEKIKEYDCDFINLKQKANIQHPYKFQDVENNWLEELKNANVNIKAECEIRRTYDIVNIRSEER